MYWADGLSRWAASSSALIRRALASAYCCKRKALCAWSDSIVFFGGAQITPKSNTRTVLFPYDSSPTYLHRIDGIGSSSTMDNGTFLTLNLWPLDMREA